MNFQIPDYQYTSPVTTGVQTGVNVYKALADAISLKDRMRQEQEMNAAKLAESAASTQQMKAQTENIPVNNLYQNLRLTTQMQGQQNSQSRFGQFHQLMQFTSTPEGAEALAKNPEMAENLLTMAGQAAYEGAHRQSPQDLYGDELGILKKMREKDFPEQKEDEEKKAPKMSENQEAVLDKQYHVDKNTYNYVDKNGTPISSDKLLPEQKMALNAVTSAQIKSFQDAANDTFEKKTNTTNTLNQRKAVTSFIETMDRGQKYLPGYLRYIGAAHKSGMLVSKFESTLTGKNDPDLNDYNNFKGTVLKDMSNEYRKIMGGQASDQEQKMVDSIIDPDQWWSNPDAAISKLNSVYETVQGFAKSLSQTQTQTKQQLQDFSQRKGDYYSTDVMNAPRQEPISQSAPTNAPMQVNSEQLQNANPDQANQLGMTRQPRELPIPQFRSKEEAQAFLGKLPPNVREHLKQQLLRKQQMEGK